MPSAGKVQIDGHHYNIAPIQDSYRVLEVPNHGDIDPKMERRVIWRNVSLGIQRRREDPSMDATSTTSSTFTYMRQVRNPQGIYWAEGCDTTRQDRIFAQKFTNISNFGSLGLNDPPFQFIDGSLVSVAVSPNRIYRLAPPGTWSVSATLSTSNEITDAIQYGGQIYVAMAPYGGAATGVTSTTLSDSTANWNVGRFIGATVTMGNSTATVASNTATTVTLTGPGWTGGTPAQGSYQLTKGLWTWNQFSTGSWTQQPNSIAASYMTIIRDQLWRAVNANIYSTINTDPTNQIWSGATVIGDPNTAITGLDVFKDFLIIFKQDGIYTADKTGNVYPIFPGFKTLGTNVRQIGQFQADYYFAADTGLVWAYSPRGGVRRVGFDFAEPYPMNPTDPTTKFSVPNVAVHQGVELTHYLIVGFSQFNPNSTSSAWFLAWDGNGWHPLHYDKSATTKSIGFTGGNQTNPHPVLHFCKTSTSGVTDILYIENPLLDPFVAASFDPSPQNIYFPVDNGALEDEFKVLERVNVIIDNPEAGKIRMAYALDENIASLVFQDMGEPQFQGTMGNQIFYPTTPLPTYNRIMLRLTLTPNAPAAAGTAATASPAARTVVMHYKQRSPQRREWDITLLADEFLISPSGRIDARNAKTIIDALNKARVTHKQVTLVDALQRTAQVYVDEVAEDIRVLKGDQNPSYLVMVKLFEAVSGK